MSIEVEAYIKLINESDWTNASDIEIFFANIGRFSESLKTALSISYDADLTIRQRINTRIDELVSMRQLIEACLDNKRFALDFVNAERNEKELN